MYQRNKRFPELFRKHEGGPWWAFIPNPKGGRQLREPTGQKDERAAHAWFLERVRNPALAPGAVEPALAKERTLETALATRIDWLKAGREHDDPTRKKKALATIDFYTKKSKPLIAVLGGETLLSEIGHEEIRGYIVTRSASAKASTIGKELTTLSCAMRLARKDGVSCPVFADIVPDDFDPLYVPRERWLTELEVDALLGVLAPKRAAVAAFIVATAATYPSEVAPIRPEHVKSYTVKGERGYVVHVPGKKRRARDRVLKVPSHARSYMALALKHLGPSGFEPWTNVRDDLHDAARLLSMCPEHRDERLAWARHVKGATKPSKEPCQACKKTPTFAPLSPNDLRRTFVQWLVRSGVPYELVYPMAGHATDHMLQRIYGKRDASAVADLVEVILKKAPKGARRRTG
jgi:hypothetical protein